uniref:Conserved secreted protein n=1 Tax=Caenorhabditis tropicalis TaxID=1561998 RepID=A0A1I7TIQ6_9PELO
MRLIHQVLFLLIFLAYVDSKAKLDLQNQGEVEEEDPEDADNDDGPQGKDVYSFLASRMNQDLGLKNEKKPIFIKYQHIGGDMNFAVPSWGMLDIYGRFYNRVQDTMTKFGYINHPVNMLDLEKEDFVKLMSDPAMQANRRAHPTLPMGKFGKQYMPMSCKPPLCNPYHMNFMLGIEHEWGGSDGMEGDIDVAVPMSKGVAYRFPFSGNLYYNRDNMTMHYGHNLSPIDPFASLFDYQKNRDPVLKNAVPRRWPRSIQEPSLQRHIGQIIRPKHQEMYNIPYQMAFMPVFNTPPFYTEMVDDYRPVIPLRRAPPRRRRRHTLLNPNLYNPYPY